MPAPTLNTHGMCTDQPHRDRAIFRVEAFPQRDGVRIAPVGELDLTTCPDLEGQLHELRDAGFGRLVLDLRQVTFLESTGVRMILTEQQLARTNGAEFSIIGGSPAVDRVLDLCGLRDHLQFTSP